MSFYLTLPSNSSMQYFPNNSLSNYITKLSNTIELNGKYEMALVEIMYPVNWKLPNHDSILIRNINKDFTKAYSIVFDALENVDEIFKKFNLQLKNDDVLVKFAYNDITKKVEIELYPDFELEFLNDLQYEFGFRAKSFQSPSKQYGPYKYIAYESISSHLNSVKALYIYCDIAEHQHVGDSMNSLLRNVIIENNLKFGDYINNTFTSPHYIPLKHNSFETIEIQITDDTGSKVHFSSGKIITKLHFRKVINFF